jgi:small-conductance mechanosensitive channel
MFDDVQQWFRAFAQPTVLVELGTFWPCVWRWPGSWCLPCAARCTATSRAPSCLAASVVDGVLFPLTLLGLVYVARTVVVQWVPLAAFKLVIPVLVALVVIRIGVKVLQAAFPQAAWVRPIERSISWLAWLAMVLWVTGLLPLVLQQLDEITWKVGASTLSVRTMIEGVVTACAVLLVTLWISSAIETRLLRSVTGSELSVRKAFSNAVRALLMFLGLILGLVGRGH